MLNLSISSPVKILSGQADAPITSDAQITSDASSSEKPKDGKFGQVLAQEMSDAGAESKQAALQTTANVENETVQTETDSSVLTPNHAADNKLIPELDSLDVTVPLPEEMLPLATNQAITVPTGLPGKKLSHELGQTGVTGQFAALTGVINNSQEKAAGAGSRFLSGQTNQLVDSQYTLLGGLVNPLDNDAANINSRAGVNQALHSRFNAPESSLLSSSEINQPAGLNNATSLFSAVASSTPLGTHAINLQTPIGQPKWEGDFAQKIVWLSNQQQTSAEIRLNPAHLGPVDVMLNLSKNELGDQEVMIQFASTHLVTREAIEAALPKLREMMLENGIALGNVSVGADSFRQQAEAGQREGGSAGNESSGVQNSLDTTDPTETQIISSRHNGVVNTFA